MTSGDDVHIHVDGSFLAQDELVDVVKRGLASGEGRVPEPVGALAIRDEQHYLATVGEIRALVERIEVVGDAKSLADKARAAQVWAERARLGADQVNLAAIAKLWAERRAGELLRDNEDFGRGRKSVTTADFGIGHNESKRWQQLAEIPPDEFHDAIVSVAEDGAVTETGVRRAAMGVHYSSASDEWSTPQDLFDDIDKEFQFDLDVCALPHSAKCERFFTPDDDGLSQEWTGNCWMNPPYGDEIAKWVQKAFDSAASRHTLVVCLVPARVDTNWWWNHCRFGEIRFLRGRLKFGNSPNAAPFPSAVVIFELGRSAGVVWWERNG